MSTASWLDDEPPAAAALAQARRLFVAGIGRRAVLLVLALFYAAALAGAAAWKKHSYGPEYVLRVVEPDLSRTGTAPPRRELAEYVRQAIFTSEPLLAIISHNGLYPGLARSDPRAALVSFRQDIDVEVRQNYFLQERALGAAPRSARLVVSYHAADADVAVSVTRQLAELVVAREQALREDLAWRATRRARADADEARDTLARRQSAVALMRAELDREAVDEPAKRVALIGMLGSLPALERLVDERDQRAASSALGSALEEHGMAMRFELVDDGLLPTGRGANGARIFAAAVAFTLGLPLLTLAVGAFTPRRAR